MKKLANKGVCSPETGRLMMTGFGALLVLMIALIWLSISNMKVHQVQLDQVVSDHMTKVGLSLAMRTSARGRSFSLMRLIVLDDPFEQDEELMRFRDHAANFISARNTLLEMPLSQTERELLAMQGELTRKAQPLQERILAQIDSGQYEQAGKLLSTEAIPAQDAVIAMVDRFDQFQRDAADQSRATASQHVARTQTLLLLLGISAVLLGGLIALGVSRAVRQRGERDAYLATHDPLTKLPNRALLMDRLQQAIRSCERNQGRLGLLFIDVDHFKSINDRHGHAIGDQALLTVRDRVQGQLRRSDTLARLSGDEFVVLLDQVPDRAAVEQMAERVVSVFDAPAQLAEQSLELSISVGVALYPEHGASEDELLSHGDNAMYRSKHQGRNCWSVYEASLTACPPLSRG